METILQYLKEMKRLTDALPLEEIDQAVEVLLHANRLGSAVYTIGNGGSASTASHFACDLAKGARIPGSRRFRAMSLVDNLPMMTAWSNDVSYADVFAEQLRGLIQPNDVLVAVSASGGSPNVLRAVNLARREGGITIGLSGFDGGALSQLVEVPIIVPSDCMEQIEDAHLMLCHLIATEIRIRMAVSTQMPLPVLDTTSEPALLGGSPTVA
jgi:D-sedoheptulose 7-phosphate isomerase